jgi:hypothetical protein
MVLITTALYIILNLYRTLKVDGSCKIRPSLTTSKEGLKTLNNQTFLIQAVKDQTRKLEGTSLSRTISQIFSDTFHPFWHTTWHEEQSSQTL